MASEWAQQRLRKWLDEVVDLNKRQIGFRIPELLDEVRKETAARCAAIASEMSNSYDQQFTRHAVGAESAAVAIRREFRLGEDE